MAGSSVRGAAGICLQRKVGTCLVACLSASSLGAGFHDAATTTSAH